MLVQPQSPVSHGLATSREVYGSSQREPTKIDGAKILNGRVEFFVWKGQVLGRARKGLNLQVGQGKILFKSYREMLLVGGQVLAPQQL